MPLSYRQSEATLRRTRSIQQNILQSTKIEENLRIQPEIARQYAIAAANRAFQLAQVTKSGEGKASTSPSPTKIPICPKKKFGNADMGSTEKPLSGAGSSTRGDRQSYITALPQVGKGCSPKSSFQRLSKSKPTFTMRKSAPTGLSPGRPQPTAEELLLQLPNPLQTTFDQELAIQMARDEYIRQIERQSLEVLNPPSGDGPKPVKHLRRTMRNTSDSSYAIAPNGVSLMPKPEHSRRRRISQTLKDTLKRIFRGGPVRTLPTQHIDAQRRHYDSTEDDEMDPIRNPIIPVPPPELVARMGARPSSDTFKESPVVETSTQAPSIRSTKSGESLRSGSRVTSWSNTVTSRGSHMASVPDPINPDCARLSVIQENLPHQTSSSARNSRAQQGYAAFEKPMQRPRTQDPIDTEKMVAELRQHIRQRDPTTIERSKGSSLLPTDRSRRGSIRQSGSTNRRSGSSRRTIRAVRPDLEDDDTTPTPKRRTKRQSEIRVAAGQDDDVFQPIPRRYRQPNPQLRHRLSLQQIADLNEGQAAAKRASLRETRSTFFPSKGQYPSIGQYSNQQRSPWRTGRQANAEFDPQKDRQVHGREHTPVESGMDSESIYSCNTSGTPCTSGVLNRASRVDKPIGTALIIETKPIIDRYSKLVSRTHEPMRTSSHRSSGSWKGWMTSEVSKLEGKNYEDKIQLSQGPGLKGIGHVRESAQQDEAEASDEKEKRPASGLKQATGTARKLSDGLRLPKRLGANSQPETHIASREDTIMERVRSAMRALSEEHKGFSVASLSNNSKFQLASQRASESALRLPTMQESPTTPFDKFMASDKENVSPLTGYDLRKRPHANETRQSPEREARLRRMQRSILSSNKPKTHGPRQYPWLQRYDDNRRDSHFTEELSPIDTKHNQYEYLPHFDENNDRGSYAGSMEEERFPRIEHGHRPERSSSDTPAFV